MGLGAGLARGWGHWGAGLNKGCSGFVVIAGLVLLIVVQVNHSSSFKFQSIVFRGPWLSWVS